MPIWDSQTLDDTPTWDASSSFEGGQVSNFRPNLLQPNQHVLLQNFDINKAGELITRRGIKIIGDKFPQIIQGIVFYQTPVSAELILAEGGILRVFGGTNWDFAGGTLQFISGNTPAVFVQGVDILYIAQSDRALAKYQSGVLSYYSSSGVAEVTTVDCTGITASTLAGKFFIIRDDVGTVGIWLDLDAAASVPATGAARDITVRVLTGDTAATVASKIAAAINPDSKFIATSNPAAVVTITNEVIGARVDAVDTGATGFAFAVTIQGRDENQSPPFGMSLLVWHTDRLIGSGVATAPDTVYFSQFLDASLWDRASWSLRVGAGEGDPITALVPWTNHNLVVIKQHSVWVIGCDPTQNVSDFQINRIHDRIGSFAPKTWCQVGTDLFGLTDSGVRSIKNIIASEQQKEVGPALSDPVGDVIERINPSAVSTSCAFHWKNRYFLAIPIDGSAQPNCVLVFNTLTESWSGKWLGWSPTYFAARLEGPTPKLCFGQADGSAVDWMDYIPLSQDTEEAYLDIEQPIVSKIVTRAFSWNEPACKKKGLAAELEFNKSRATVEAKVIRDDAAAETWEPSFSTQQESLSLPITLPATLPRSGVKRKPFDIFRFDPFRELQFQITSTGGKLQLRSISASAFVDPVVIQDT